MMASVPPPPPGTPDGPGAPVGPGVALPPTPKKSGTNRFVIGLAIVVIVLLVVSLIEQAGSGNGGPTSFSARVLDSGISPGGRWVVVVEVTNRGDDPGSPSCSIRAIDGDGVPLAGDVADLSVISPGATETTEVTTGLKPGKDLVASWQVECE